MTRRDMVEALGISDSTFTKWNVKPVGKIGRNTYYWFRDVLENRIRHKRRQLGRCDECGYSKEELIRRNANWNGFCPKCNHPIAGSELLSDQKFWENS